MRFQLAPQLAPGSFFHLRGVPPTIWLAQTRVAPGPDKYRGGVRQHLRGNAGEAGCRGNILARPALNAARWGHSPRLDRNPHTPRDRGRWLGDPERVLGANPQG